MEVNKLTNKVLGAAILALLAISVVGLVSVVAVQASSTAPSTTNTQQDLQVQEMYPTYQGSIIIPESCNDTDLASMAKITADQAKTAAATNMSVPVTSVQSVSLENENGYLVYSVHVLKQGIVYDVKVDAGNGHVLFVEQGADGGEGTSTEP
jgi:uncharacterized membrane protein YkoI